MRRLRTSLPRHGSSTVGRSPASVSSSASSKASWSRLAMAGTSPGQTERARALHAPHWYSLLPNVSIHVSFRLRGDA
eukprot:3487143-Prymnesium_polylepis.1